MHTHDKSDATTFSRKKVNLDASATTKKRAPIATFEQSENTIQTRPTRRTAMALTPEIGKYLETAEYDASEICF